MQMRPAAWADAAPSAWLQRCAGLVRPGGSVLDVACGSGRNLRWLTTQGFAVTGIDRDDAATAPLRELAEIVSADLEAGPWPLPAGRRFDAVVVCNYLWRPLWPALLDALAGDGGVLVCETFGHGQARIGRPRRPEFLLQDGELLRLCAGLRVVAFEDGFEDGFDAGPPDGGAAGSAGQGRFVQRIAAVRQAANTAPDQRLQLHARAAGNAPGGPGSGR